MFVSFHPRTCQGQGKQDQIATKTNATVAVVKLVGFFRVLPSSLGFRSSSFRMFVDHPINDAIANKRPVPKKDVDAQGIEPWTLYKFAR